MPLRFRIGAPRRLLVIAPHPDDEAIGAYALMSRLRRRGVSVRVVVVTDGAASHPNSPRWPRRRLVAERRRESRRALCRIGVAAGAMTFLDLPDGRLHTRIVAARRGLARALGHVGPALIAAPAASDDHPDHRTVAACVAALRRPKLRRLAYPVWPAGRQPAGARCLFLTAQERLAKRHAVRSYRTQAGRIMDDPAGFAMTRRHVAAFTRQQEVFVEVRR
ncbi:PIG-L family deacetylase [Sphingomonas sp. BK235]|uniref:PIG-L deacetylase family protein n=1 Tax=Sphingomonas sp. BK235 TaxID=2512131 RepID=UPI0010457F78|nr:PIG-L family deacetylase [Sphingomonas sp. BK235]TCP29194.1 LmbE family N-acetylglucosaminyl deacetylase [Sphingomonas sp. BK235]